MPPTVMTASTANADTAAAYFHTASIPTRLLPSVEACAASCMILLVTRLKSSGSEMTLSTSHAGSELLLTSCRPRASICVLLGLRFCIFQLKRREFTVLGYKIFLNTFRSDVRARHARTL